MTTRERILTRVNAPRIVVPLAAAAVLLIVLGGWMRSEALTDQRRADVASRGGPVMGFDLDATVHRFTTTDTGGIQQVVARDPADGTQVDAVRAHLTEEAEGFAAGDFSSPATIHGDDMRGLAALSAAPDGAVGVEHAQIDGGAQLTFTAASPQLVQAVHAWMDAQLYDHGDDAEAGTAHDQHQGG